MYSDFNSKSILLLFVLSLVCIVAHRSGLLSVSLEISKANNHHEITVFTMGDTSATLESHEEGVKVLCDVQATTRFNLCGVSFALSEHLDQGVDLSIYDRVSLDISYSSVEDFKKIKFSLRNFNENYSNNEDLVSLKFNSIEFSPENYANKITVPLNAFQVENWWVRQYGVDFNNSYFDVSNVSLLEIITNDLKKVGVSEIQVGQVVLHGELLSEKDLLKLILLIWLVFAGFLVFRQKNIHSKLSSTDPLTGCLNRRGLKEYLEKKTLFSGGLSNYFLIYIDIDNFKRINDIFGHVVGDELLVLISRSLQGQVQKGAVISRLSGDEFSVILNVYSREEISEIVLAVMNYFQTPLSLENHKILINLNVGIVEIDTESDTFESLMLKADSAMYYAKKQGGNQYKIFDESVENEIIFRKSVVENIKKVIETNDFNLNYMPIVSCDNLRTKSVEVLLRSYSEALKGIGPDIFIPIAEEYDLIEEIDFWVIEATFKQMSSCYEWISSLDIVYCINISSLEMHNVDFISRLKLLLNKYQIETKYLELEITETSLIEIDSNCIEILNEIRLMGIKLALDDFGTGYTAFNQLINYPVDCLKIDKSFVDGVCIKGASHETMIKAIVSIAQSYKLTTIAEGIETEEQYHRLKELGCDMLQGYFFSKPLTWEQYTLYIQKSFETDLDLKSKNELLDY